MERFPVHTLNSAPEASKSALRDVQARFGMIPNLAGAMATSPVLIQSFIGIFDKVHGGSFSEPQIQTVLLTDAVTNACTWAVALHTALGPQAGLDPADVDAMRAGRSPSDKKLGALSTLARTLIEKRGRLAPKRGRYQPSPRPKSKPCRLARKSDRVRRGRTENVVQVPRRTPNE